MLVPNRHGSSNSYRYGFQGQEKDDELKGEGNSLNYTFRMHDPRVGRFFATDPLESRYSFMTPYQFSSNSTIGAVELEGLEGEDIRFRQWMRSQGRVQAQSVQVEEDIKREAARTVLVEMPEVTIDGLSYTSTSLFQSILGGFSFGFGEVFFNDGYKTRIDIPTIGFKWDKGFYSDSNNATTGNVNFKDGLRIINGLTTIFSLGELAVINRSSVVLRNTDIVNQSFIKRGYYAPYKVGTNTVEYAVKGVDDFVRVSGPNNIKGDWLVKKAEIEGLTPAQIKDKLSLKYEPTHISDVKVGDGTKMRKGTASEVKEFGTNGGATQYEILEGKNIEFSNTRRLK